MRMSMNPPPPRLPAAGQVTAIASAVATAASTALPPFFMMSTPTCAAIPLVADTIPRRAMTGSRIAEYAAVAEKRSSVAISFRMEAKCTCVGHSGRDARAPRLRPVIGVDGDVVVAEVGGENDGRRRAATEVEEDGDAFASEDFRGIFLFVNGRRAVRDQLHVRGEERHALDVEARAAASEGGQHAAPIRIAAVQRGLDERRRCDGVRGQLRIALALRFAHAVPHDARGP